MGFQNLRSNNIIYILHKGISPKLEIGKVLTVSLPIPRYPGVYNSESMVDITANVNDVSTNFQKLPAHLDITDVGSDIVISCNKDLINSEIQAIKQKSQDIIASIDNHRQIIAGCDDIIRQLNPEITEKERQQLETESLKEEINSLKEMFKDFMNNYNK